MAGPDAAGFAAQSGERITLDKVRMRLRRVDAMADEGASLAQIAGALGVPEMTLVALAERFLVGRSRHGSSAALNQAAKAVGVTRAQMMARILQASLD